MGQPASQPTVMSIIRYFLSKELDLVLKPLVGHAPTESGRSQFTKLVSCEIQTVLLIPQCLIIL